MKYGKGREGKGGYELCWNGKAVSSWKIVFREGGNGWRVEGRKKKKES